MCILAFNPSSPGVYSIQLKSLNNAICIPVSSPHQRARHPMAVLHASQSILEKCAQTQGQTQVLMLQPAASVAAATQATHTTGISMVSTQAGVKRKVERGQELMCTCSRGEHDSITRPARR